MPLKQIDNKIEKYPAEAAIGIISGKWKAMILFHLMKEIYRFNELKRLLPKISQRMLTNQLRELEADGLVYRKIYAEVPPKVEYSLTERGQAVRPVLAELRRLGENIQNNMRMDKVSNDKTF